MVKIKNVNITELQFESKDKNFQQCLEYMKLVTDDYKKFLPKRPKHQLTFEITETSSELANCIRRFLMDEILVTSMHVEEDNVETNDMFILSDFLKKNIELVPFEQSLSDSDTDKVVVSLDVENKTDDIITVYSGDLTVTIGKKLVNKKNNHEYFTTTIPIIKLRPTKSISVSDIKLVKGFGKHDAGKFVLLSNITYKILDVKPVEETKYNKTGESSLNSTPKHFRLGFKTHRNIKPKDVMYKCCDQITQRFVQIQDELSRLKPNVEVHFSDLIDLESKGDIKIFHFKGEYWTLANLMSKYCYLLDTDIKFVTSGIVHPNTEEAVLKIQHNDPVKLLNTVIKTILTDVAIIRKAF